MPTEYQEWTYQENVESKDLFKLPKTCFAKPPPEQNYTVQATVLLPKDRISLEDSVTSYLKTCCSGNTTTEENCGYTCTYYIERPWDATGHWWGCVAEALNIPDRDIIRDARVEYYIADSVTIKTSGASALRETGVYMMGLMMLVPMALPLLGIGF